MKGMLLYATGNLEAGMALVLEARAIQERLGDCEGGGVALSFLASMTFAKGDLEAALAIYADAEATLERVGDKPEIARVQCEMGYAALAGDQFELARNHFRRALRTYEEIGSPRGAGQALFGLAAVEGALNNLGRAIQIAAAAQAMSERAGAVVDHPMAPGMAERIASLRAAIPKQELDGLVAAGSTLTPAAVLEMVAA
jgi:tetratricopeptide (TPR) repeat protein